MYSDFLGRTLLEFLANSVALAIAGLCALDVALWVNNNLGSGPWEFLGIVFGLLLFSLITLVFLARVFRTADITQVDSL